MGLEPTSLDRQSSILATVRPSHGCESRNRTCVGSSKGFRPTIERSRTNLAAHRGFEPRYEDSESSVLAVERVGNYQRTLAVQVGVEPTSSRLTVERNAVIRPHN